MKKQIVKLTSILMLTLFSAFALYAENADEEKSPWALSLTTDAAFDFKSDYVSGPTHFAPITKVYGGIEACITLNGSYTLATPLGESWLVKDAHVAFGAAMELSPITFKPTLSIEFQPLPFFVLSAGGSFGIGWNMLGFEGLCAYDYDSDEYQKLSTFEHPYYEAWAKATIMFDTGAIFAGDWTHVVMMANFKTMYAGVMNIGRNTVYEWQASKNQVQGLQYDAQVVLGYQMPLVLSLAGIRFQATGHFDGSDYGAINSTFDGAFASISLSPLFQFSFGDKDSLICLLDFSSRRSFAESNTAAEDVRLHTVGREWYFRRVAFSYTHKFF